MIKTSKNFVDLNVWKFGHNLVISIYRITAAFPKQEQYGLGNQMNRAAVSVTSNIAEGFGRFGKREKIRFHNISTASLSELQNQILIARDIGYVDVSTGQILFEQTCALYRQLNALVSSIKQR